jgi:hypothetical protein
MKMLSNELGAFMMRIANGRFAHHIMNTFMMWIVKRDVGVFSVSVFEMKNVNPDQ